MLLRNSMIALHDTFSTIVVHVLGIIYRCGHSYSESYYHCGFIADSSAPAVHPQLLHSDVAGTETTRRSKFVASC